MNGSPRAASACHASAPKRTRFIHLPRCVATLGVEGRFSRRAGLELGGLAAIAGPGCGEAEEQVGHPPVARWRAESSGDLRPQARGDQRVSRAVGRDRDERFRHPHLRATPVAREARGQDGFPPLSASQDGRPFRGRALDAHGALRFHQHGQGAEVSLGRVVCGPHARAERAGAAGLRWVAGGAECLPVSRLSGRGVSGAGVQSLRCEHGAEVSRGEPDGAGAETAVPGELHRRRGPHAVSRGPAHAARRLPTRVGPGAADGCDGSVSAAGGGHGHRQPRA